MEKDFMYNDYTGDSVINRGYKIYDEWKAKRLSSRKIVASVERAVFTVEQNKSKAAIIDALSCLFALDLRVTEKYDTFWKCLVHYFSWRSENGALKRLKVSFHISDDEDIRTAIEIELQRLGENIETDESEEGDDETRGGKRNGKSEEETVAAEENAQEQALEENAEEMTDAEESKEVSEEKVADVSEETTTGEPINESEEKQQNDELSQEEAEIPEQEEKEQVVQEEQSELKEENNGPDEASEPSTDKKEEAKSYNDAVDSPPLYEETVSERKTEKTSFIDEMIIDNMVKGDKSIIGYQRIDEAERLKEADIPQDTVANQNEKNKSTDKDAYLYDKMVETDKGEPQQTLNVESTKQAEKVSETKTEQPKETIQNNDNANSTEQEFKPLSDMLQSDNPNVDMDNNIADEI
ncbi:MAG: hypothetical protein J6Q78_02740, partial [Clostridia bacterium]|nr:hypothetical protein [Clostridia bacterium]